MSLVSLKRFATLPEAELTVNFLSSRGIAAVLQKDGIPGSTGLLQGAELFVDDRDFVAAREILAGS